MDFIIDAIVEWLKGLLVDGIMGNLDGLFDNVNQSVGEIATQVGTTPADWNAGVFSMIRQISETAILPIAGVILTFVMTYELIQMLIERNNLHEVDTWMFFKWVFKTFVAVMILTNTFNIVLAVFDVSQHVIQQSAGIIMLWGTQQMSSRTAINDTEDLQNFIQMGLIPSTPQLIITLGVIGVVSLLLAVYLYKKRSE